MYHWKRNMLQNWSKILLIWVDCKVNTLNISEYIVYRVFGNYLLISREHTEAVKITLFFHRKKFLKLPFIWHIGPLRDTQRFIFSALNLRGTLGFFFYDRLGLFSREIWKYLPNTMYIILNNHWFAHSWQKNDNASMILNAVWSYLGVASVYDYGWTMDSLLYA